LASRYNVKLPLQWITMIDGFVKQRMERKYIDLRLPTGRIHPNLAKSMTSSHCNVEPTFARAFGRSFPRLPGCGLLDLKPSAVRMLEVPTTPTFGAPSPATRKRHANYCFCNYAAKIVID